MLCLLYKPVNVSADNDLDNSDVKKDVLLSASVIGSVCSLENRLLHEEYRLDKLFVMSY